jgi:hypothetical protein
MPCLVERRRRCADVWTCKIWGSIEDVLFVLDVLLCWTYAKFSTMQKGSFLDGILLTVCQYMIVCLFAYPEFGLTNN